MDTSKDKITVLVDTWFGQQHEEIIEKLAKQPKTQMDYVLRVLKAKEQEIDSIKIFK